MARHPRTNRSETPVPPLAAAALDGLALSYVARYATTRAKLAAYLARKLRERGWAGPGEAPIEAIVARCAALGYVDDRAFATARGAALGRRGYGARRIAVALRAAGIDDETAGDACAAAGEGALAAALAYARRRRIGPFAAHAPDRDQARRAMAALMRAGHDPAIARRVATAAPGAVLDEE